LRDTQTYPKHPIELKLPLEWSSFHSDPPNYTPSEYSKTKNVKGKGQSPFKYVYGIGAPRGCWVPEKTYNYSKLIVSLYINIKHSVSGQGDFPDGKRRSCRDIQTIFFGGSFSGERVLGDQNFGERLLENDGTPTFQSPRLASLFDLGLSVGLEGLTL